MNNNRQNFTFLVKDYCDKRKNKQIDLENMLLNTRIEHNNIRPDENNIICLLSCFDITPEDVMRICGSMDVLVKLSENAKHFFNNSVKFPQAQFVHEVEECWMIIVLYHVLNQCYPEFYDYIIEDENWSDQEKCKKTVQLYYSEFLNKIYEITSSNPWTKEWIKGLKVDAVIFIISMHKLKHIDLFNKEAGIDIVNHFFKEIINQEDEVKERLNKLFPNFKEESRLKAYAFILESCINEGTFIVKPWRLELMN